MTANVDDSLDAPLLNLDEAVQLPRVEPSGLRSPSSQTSLGAALRRRSCLVCATVTLFFALLGVFVVPLVLHNALVSGIRGNVVIDSEFADGFPQFKDSATDGVEGLEVYMFNITNPYGILKGEKPRVKEVGPWIYRSRVERGDFAWDLASDLLTFREHTSITFDRNATMKRTNGTYDHDKVPILTVNMIFSGMRSQLGDSMLHVVNDVALWKTDFDRIFSRQTVHEFVTGYTVFAEFLGFKMPIAFPGLYPNTSKANDPSWTKKTTMKIGRNNISEAYELVSWREMQSVRTECPWGVNPLAQCPANAPCCRSHNPFSHKNAMVPVWGPQIYPGAWDSDANKVHGRSGEQFAPGVDSSAKLTIFNDIIWRALRFENKDQQRVNHKGIEMLRFTPIAETFMNASEYPPNARYYQFGPRGLFGNLTMVEQGSDLYASQPHFLGGDDSLINGVEGLAPDPHLHQLQIDVEPVLGQTMVEHVRAQLNSRLIGNLSWGTDQWLPRVRDGTFVPIAWFDITSEISDKGVVEYQQIPFVQNTIVVCRGVSWIFFLSALVWILASLHVRHRDKKKLETEAYML